MNPVRALLVALVLALPAGAAIVAGAEVPLDPATMVIPAGGRDPRVASNGLDALVVWRDSRGHPDEAVRALSLKNGLPDGEELVLDEGRDLEFADVASNGDGYLVVYESFEGTFAARIEERRITHRNDAVTGRPLDLASNGTTYCLLADESSMWPKRVASFLDTNGGLLAKVEVSADSERLVALDGQYWLIANDGERIDLFAISPSGSGERRLLAQSGDAEISAIAGRDHMLVAWQSDRVHYIVLDESGVPVSPLATLNDEIPQSWPDAPSLAWDGSEFLLSWPLFTSDPERGGKMGAIRIGTDGQRRNAEPFVVAGIHDEDRFDAAFDGTRVVLVDVEGHDDRRVLRARTIEAFAAHRFEEGVALSMRGQTQSAGAIAASGDTILALWAELPRLRGLLRRADGTTIPLEIAATSSATPATVTAAGSVFLVTWQSEGTPELLARRIRNDGEVLDRDPLSIARTSELPRVASDGVRFLVAWRETGRIRGVFVPAAGAVGAQATLAITRRITPSYLTVGWTGAAYVIAWSTGDPDEHTFIRAGADGTVLTAPAVLAQPGHWSGDNGAIAIGAGDDAAIAVWQERECLWSRPLDADGRSAGPPRTISCSPAISRAIDVNVSWDGGSWFVLWSQRDRPGRLFGIRTDKDRWPVGDVFALDVPFGRGLVRGTTMTGNALWMLYDRVVPEAPYSGVRRAFVRPVYFEPQSRRARSIRH